MTRPVTRPARSPMARPVSEVLAAASALAEADGIPELVHATREACTRLRWHPALRRRIPEAAAESRVRGAAASAEIDGARLSIGIVRDLLRGAVTWHADPDPVERVAQGALTATAETERLSLVLTSAPLQALVRLHTAAAAGLVDPDRLGRPRTDADDCQELVELGPPPSAAQARARLAMVTELLTQLTSAPTLVVAALVHAEIATARPFVAGNGIVARALERLVLQVGGLDPTGVAVPEVGHLRAGPGYLGSLLAYGEGTMPGVMMWISHCASAIGEGAVEGERIADAVLAGRLTPG